MIKEWIWQGLGQLRDVCGIDKDDLRTFMSGTTVMIGSYPYPLLRLGLLIGGTSSVGQVTRTQEGVLGSAAKKTLAHGPYVESLASVFSST